jgi:protocatechuate 3,4-dioxygenase beta subunit
MYHRAVRVLLIAATLSSPAYALPECQPTARLATSAYPGPRMIPTTNNLILPTGKSIESEGQKLIFSGRLVDKQCKPIPEAVVELWHANPFGKRVLADKAEMATPYPTFAGAGRTVTDSEGRFTFTTAFPGVSGGYWVKPRKGPRYYVPRAPHFNIRVNAPDMAVFSTILFFENDHRNYTDSVYKPLSIERRRTVTMNTVQQEEDVQATIQLVLPGLAHYRTY